MHYQESNLASVRETARLINKSVASGLMPPIQILVLNEDTKEMSSCLLCLLLLQSMDKDIGKIIMLVNQSKRYVTWYNPSHQWTQTLTSILMHFIPM